jgi:2,3-bisphosphoglycerate-dependent phosphoglycerate mutase
MPQLILLRHGQSQFNLENRFTGWLDVPLTPAGEEEARQTGRALKNKSFVPQIAFTSELQRAQKTLALVLTELEITQLPIVKNVALNERHYGTLQGKNKAETAAQFSEEQVHIWRRSFDVPPPEGESLKDTAARTLPYFREKIIAELKSGKNVLVVAHGNSLRSIVMEIEKMSPEQILKTEIGTGVAWTYDFSEKSEFIRLSPI